MNFSVAIPTYNREEDLNNCLNSILNQTLLPYEILIIDDGDLSKDFINIENNKFLAKNIDFIYYKKNHKIERRGSSESRNKIIELVNNNIFFILDDDLILDNNFLEKIINVWRRNKNEKLIGVGGLIRNNRKKNRIEKIYNFIFCLTSKYKWDVNEVAFQVWDEEVRQNTFGYYSHGGVCSYNRKLAKKLGFTVFGGGRTALEDVDFCLRAKNKGYNFIFNPNAKVVHNESLIGRETMFLIGLKEGKNRKIIFKNNSEKNIKNYIWFYWSNIGWILRQFLIGNFKKGFGMVKGFYFQFLFYLL